jgi:two-component system, chemotaxis family, chemotaxis protein CheY
MVQGDLSNTTVLVIDDVETSLIIFRSLLEVIGVGTILTAKNGQEGLDVLNGVDGNVDAIVCDLVMPVMDGHEFIENLRALDDENTSKIPVIVVTSKNRIADIKRASNAGVQAYLLKPVELKILEKWLRESLGETA